MIQDVQNLSDVDAKDAAAMDTGTDDKTDEKKVDLNELAAQLEQIKKAQAGSDKAYQETAKQLAAVKAENDKLKKSSMDAEERASFEREQKEKELEERERAVNNANLRLSLVEGLGAAEMGTEWADFVPGSNSDEITENIGKLKELINKEVGKRVNSTLNSTVKPKSGEPAKGDGPVDFKNLSLQDVERLAKEGKLKL